MGSPATAYLASFLNYETQFLQKKGFHFHLKSIKHLLAELGHPEQAYPVIHVVGTKGKGSTSLFISSMLREAELRVGLYTSPHLYNITERIRVLGPKKILPSKEDVFSGRISPYQLAQVLKEIKPHIEKMRREKNLSPMTFFEVYTALAFYFFAQQKVDVVVAEAGLGGRWDATNASASEICVVTPISHDHTQILGRTIKAIAREKAAVIKASTRVVFSAPQKKQARLVIEKQAKHFGLKVYRVGKDIRYHKAVHQLSGSFFALRGLTHRWARLCSPLLGEHQVVNASLAAAVVEYFLKDKGVSPQAAVAKGLARARWPARFEIVAQKPFIIIDSAHNEDSAQKLKQTIKEIFPKKKIILIFGASKDKDIRGILKQLGDVSREVILTRSQHPRSFYFSTGREMPLKTEKIFVARHAREALKMASQRARSQDVILVAGSIFLAGEIRALCQSTK